MLDSLSCRQAVGVQLYMDMRLISNTFSLKFYSIFCKIGIFFGRGERYSGSLSYKLGEGTANK